MDNISTIIRFHNCADLALLERSLDSLHSQVNVSVTPIIVTQKFKEQESLKVKELVDDIWYFSEHQKPIIVNLANPKHSDARSELINVGISQHIKTKNKYLAFLDYDDILYSHAYNLLIESNKRLQAGLSFAYIDVCNELVLDKFLLKESLQKPFNRGNKIDLLEANFCPLHSYVINCDMIDSTELYFRENMSRVEDYEFLLRIGSKVPLDFSNLDKVVGLYSMRNDGSNSTPNNSSTKNEIVEKQKIWRRNQELLLQYRSEIEVKFFALDFVK